MKALCIAACLGWILLAGCASDGSGMKGLEPFSPNELPPAVIERTESGSAEASFALSNAVPEGMALDVQESILLALQQNSSFRLERLQPLIMATHEREARAVFDPMLSGSLYFSDPLESDYDRSAKDSLGASIGIKEFLPTGTKLEAGLGRAPETGKAPSSENFDVKVTQALLRGLGMSANLARLRQARIETEISAYELRGAAESLVAQVEGAYWDCVLAQRAIAIYEQSLKIAEQEIAEAKERIRLGAMAETELAAAEAELASRREKMIDAKSELAKSRLIFLRLLNPHYAEPFERNIALSQPPELNGPVVLDDVKAHVALGLKQRADLNQARLAVLRGELEVARTRNGLLPKLDLFIQIGGTRYSESFSSYDANEWSKEAVAGLAMELPLLNRAELATRERAVISLERTKGAIENMSNLIELEIRTAYLEVVRAEEQVKAKEATLKLRDETLQAEMEKLRVGRSTSLLVAQASRDRVESEIARMSSLIARRKALLALFRLEGSLLERRGISSVEGDNGSP